MDRQWIMNRLEVGGALPILKPDIVQLFQRISKPNWQSDASGVESLLRRQGLADLFWQQIRSPFFTCSTESESLRELLEWIDQQTVCALLSAFLLRRILPTQLGRARSFDRAKYRRHTLGTAVAARILAARTKISQPDRVFAYGLIHDLGVTVLDICLPDLLDEICHVMGKGSRQVVAEQVILYGMTHEDLGGWLCDKWQLPLVVKAVVKYHHRPLLPTIAIDETKLLYLSDMLSAEQYGDLIGHGLPAGFEETVRGHLGVTQAALAAVERELPLLINETANLLE